MTSVEDSSHAPAVNMKTRTTSHSSDIVIISDAQSVALALDRFKAGYEQWLNDGGIEADGRPDWSHFSFLFETHEIFLDYQRQLFGKIAESFLKAEEREYPAYIKTHFSLYYAARPREQAHESRE